MTRQEIQKQKDEALSKVAECDRQLAELPVYDENWKPKVGEMYSFIKFDGLIGHYAMTDRQMDSHALDGGNYYPTEAQAERHAPVIAAFRKLLKAADASEDCFRFKPTPPVSTHLDVDTVRALNYKGQRD